MIRTELCGLCGIKYPIFQGGMAHISDARLASAVSNAGGLGIISAMSRDGEYLREQIRLARTMTKAPIGVNVMLMSPYVGEVADVIAEEGVEVVTTGAGDPSAHIEKWKTAGCHVIPVVPSVALARRMKRFGADAVIAEGGESGGHIGDMATLPLVPQVADAVNIPVIAAGGIGDGRGVAAAFMLGASGVQLGTRFLVAAECGVHPHYKELIIKASDTSTIVTGRRLGHAVRSLKTPYSRNYAKKEYTDISSEELEALGVGSLRRAAVDGDEKEGCYLAGQIAGLVNREQTAAEIIEEIMTEAERVLSSTSRYIE